MNLNESILLESMAEEARAGADRLREKTDFVTEQLKGRIGENGIGELIFELIFAGALFITLTVLTFGSRMMPGLYVALGIPGIIASALVLVGKYKRLRYYGTFIKMNDELRAKQTELSKVQETIGDVCLNMTESGKTGWNRSLTIHPSIPESIAVTEKSISGMETLKKGVLSEITDYAFYLYCAAETLLIGLMIRYRVLWFTDDLFSGGDTDFSYSFLNVVNIISLIAAVVGAVLLGRLIRAKTNNTTGNLAMLTPAIGVAGFALLDVLLVFAVFLLKYVVAGIIILVIAAIVFGAVSGG